MPLRIYDSFAILKLFQKEKNYHKVARLLEQDLRRKEAPLLQIINFGEIIYRTAISYADAFLLATALREKATIVTGDPEFKKVQSLSPIEWI